MSYVTKIALLSLVVGMTGFSLQAYPETTGDSPVLNPVARGTR